MYYYVFIYKVEKKLCRYIKSFISPQETFDPEKVKGLLPLGGTEESSKSYSLDFFSMGTIVHRSGNSCTSNEAIAIQSWLSFLALN